MSDNGRPMKRVATVCGWCKKPLRYGEGSRKYHPGDCARLAENERQRLRKRAEKDGVKRRMKNCVVCGKEFEIEAPAQQYCRKCQPPEVRRESVLCKQQAWYNQTYKSKPPKREKKRTYTMADINACCMSQKLENMFNNYQPSGLVGRSHAES